MQADLLIYSHRRALAVRLGASGTFWMAALWALARAC
jgi:hypothetical protein